MQRPARQLVPPTTPPRAGPWAALGPGPPGEDVKFPPAAGERAHPRGVVPAPTFIGRALSLRGRTEGLNVRCVHLRPRRNR